MKVYLIAGEPSGDKLGGALIAGLRQLVPDVEIQGVGGPEMEAQGLRSLFPMSELSVMGLAEVLPKLRSLFRRRDETVEDIARANPDVLITIDSPDFCLRVARKLRKNHSIRTIHYVAPTVWAWRPRRIEKMRGVIDHVLALFPFEPPYMEAADMGCDFVGHPITSEPLASRAEVEAFRSEHGLGDAPILLALPGSRGSEVTRLASVFGQALQPVLDAHPDMRVVVPTVPHLADLVRQHTKSWPGQPLIVGRSEKAAAFRAATVALAASGTVSLELAANDVPMVIAYDMNWVSRQMIKALLRVDTVTLVNLVSETRAVPEYLGENCKPLPIAKGILKVLGDPSQQQDACRLTMERLGRGGEDPGLRAARAVMRVVP